MNTKLTLTIEKEVINIAKEYAKEKGQSLSEMVENYFKLVTVNRGKIKEKQLSPKVRNLRGIIKTGVSVLLQADFNRRAFKKIWRINFS